MNPNPTSTQQLKILNTVIPNLLTVVTKHLMNTSSSNLSIK